MDRPIRNRRRAAWLAAILAMASPAEAADEPPRSLPGAVVEATASQPVRAVVAVEGTAASGLKIRLRGSGSTGQGLSYRWLQTWGPEAEIDDPDRADPSVIVPRGSGTLVFVLMVRNADGADAATLRVPIRWDGAESPPPGLVADAGDDLRTPVGRQITLNGIRSQPRGEIGFRWVQVDGPPVSLAIADGYVYTFVPTEPGFYRFALLVASGGSISEPDFVRVEVTSGVGVPVGSTKQPPRSIEELAASALVSVGDGADRAGLVASAFEGVADRIELYGSFDVAFREIALRLDAVLPNDAEARSRWATLVFEPLSAALVRSLRSSGVDLARPEGRAATLAPSQRDELAAQFRAIADGFRAVGTPASGPLSPTDPVRDPIARTSTADPWRERP